MDLRPLCLPYQMCPSPRTVPSTQCVPPTVRPQQQRGFQVAAVGVGKANTAEKWVLGQVVSQVGVYHKQATLREGPENNNGIKGLGRDSQGDTLMKLR